MIVRLSDFKSNEYANLIGGELYEPHEENPMLGYRGASRYISPDFRACFDMECEALKFVRDEMGLTNVEIMVPFVRTVGEAHAVIELLGENGLRRGENGLRVIMMCELPVQRRARRRVPGVLRRVLDRLQRHDPAHPGPGPRLRPRRRDVRRARPRRAEDAVDGDRRPAAAPASTSASAARDPSDHPDLAEWLVAQGIESMSLNPDTVVETWLRLAAKSPARA